MDFVVKDKEDVLKFEDLKDNNFVYVLEKSIFVDINKIDYGKMINDSVVLV